MTQLDELKNQMNKIMQENKPSVVYNSQEDRRIREIETELYRAEIKVPFKMTLGELVPELAEEAFAGGSFKHREYALSWEEDSKGDYRLTLTNLPHNHSKVLITTPEPFKKDILPLLDGFLMNFHAVLPKDSAKE